MELLPNYKKQKIKMQRISDLNPNIIVLEGCFCFITVTKVLTCVKDVKDLKHPVKTNMIDTSRW